MLSQLKKPRFMLFDYGETLGHEDDFCPGAGFTALLEAAVENPMGVDGTRMLEAFAGCFAALRLKSHEIGAEIPNLIRWRWLFEMFDLRFLLTDAQLEDRFWNAAAPCVPTPGVKGLLERLRRQGIPSGVISNMGFSGNALRRRLERLFPEHRFEFVMSSADYVLRKPDPHLFRLALKKTGCRPEEVWFAGDNLAADITGAAGVGMIAVHYDRDLGCAYWKRETPEKMPPCLRIEDWSELYGYFGEDVFEEFGEEI